MKILSNKIKFIASIFLLFCNISCVQYFEDRARAKQVEDDVAKNRNKLYSPNPDIIYSEEDFSNLPDYDE